MDENTLNLLNKCYNNISNHNKKMANNLKKFIDEYEYSLSIDKQILTRLNELVEVNNISISSKEHKLINTLRSTLICKSPKLYEEPSEIEDKEPSEIEDEEPSDVEDEEPSDVEDEEPSDVEKIDVFETFAGYILENKPKWYKEGKWIKKDIIYNNCVKQCGILSKKAFATKYKNVLFRDEDRKMVNRERCYIVKLFRYDEIIDCRNTIKVYTYTDINWVHNLTKNINRDSEWVYFIQDSNGIKVGITKNLQKRMKGLQTGNSCKLKLIAYIETDDMFSLEKQLHNHLKPLSIVGEWFKLDKGKTFIMLKQLEKNNKIQYDF
jgi:hypothetical protein